MDCYVRLLFLFSSKWLHLNLSWIISFHSPRLQFPGCSPFRWEGGNQPWLFTEALTAPSPGPHVDLGYGARTGPGMTHPCPLAFFHAPRPLSGFFYSAYHYEVFPLSFHNYFPHFPILFSLLFLHKLNKLIWNPLNILSLSKAMDSHFHHHSRCSGYTPIPADNSRAWWGQEPTMGSRLGKALFLILSSPLSLTHSFTLSCTKCLLSSYYIPGLMLYQFLPLWGLLLNKANQHY